MTDSTKNEFLNLISISEAKDILYQELKSIRKVGFVSVDESVNKILAETIYSPMDSPPFDRSLRDGYCVRAEDTYGITETEPKQFEIISSIQAGQNPPVEITSLVRFATSWYLSPLEPKT